MAMVSSVRALISQCEPFQLTPRPFLLPPPTALNTPQWVEAQWQHLGFCLSWERKVGALQISLAVGVMSPGVRLPRDKLLYNHATRLHST